MRKLTKKSLEDLAKTMSVIDETEQQNFVGGTFYYDYNGNYLGSYGTGNDVRIATSMSDIGGSIAFSSAPSSVVGSVLTNMSRFLGYSGIVGISYNDNETNYGSATAGQIMYNPGSPAFVGDNNFNFWCTLVHEMHHVNTPGDVGTDQSEYYAILSVKNSYYYTMASEQYKIHVENNLTYYRNILGYSF